jgi:hypothetical protein
MIPESIAEPLSRQLGSTGVLTPRALAHLAGSHQTAQDHFVAMGNRQSAIAGHAT